MRSRKAADMGFSSGGVQIARIFGIPIILHLTFFIVLVFVTIVLGTADGIFPAMIEPRPSTATVWVLAVVSAIFFFVSILLHELAHSLVAKVHGLPVRNITLFALGGVSQIARESERPLPEFLIAVVGPLSSALIGGALFGIWFATGQGHSPVDGDAALAWLYEFRRRRVQHGPRLPDGRRARLPVDRVGVNRIAHDRDGGGQPAGPRGRDRDRGLRPVWLARYRSGL